MQQLKTTIIDYKNGIYAIDQGMVRAFLVVGEHKALLIDTGAVRIDMPSYISQVTSLPVEVVLTHGDGDHIANLQDFPSAFIHPNDIEAVSSHDGCKGVKLDAVSQGDVFDIGGRKLKVLFTPGHTAGSICLLDEANGILFSGDSISYGPVFMFGAKRNMAQYLDSLRLLKRMKDDGAFSLVYCCHNTCPIPADTVEDLISCVTGILDKSIAGAVANMPIPTGDNPLIGKFGNCAVLFD